MDPIALLAALCVLGAIVLALMGLYNATSSPRSSMERRLGRMLGESYGDDIISEAASEALRQHRTGKIPFIGMFVAGKPWTETLAEDLERADIKLTVDA